MRRGEGWSDLISEGRGPGFALICLGVWLSAADSLVTATIMPSVGRSLGGYAYFGWATAGYLLASVVTAASAAFVGRVFGLRRGAAAAALLYAGGCALSAGAPDMAVFLVGRVLQGLGGGWVVGLCSAAIGLMFPDRTLPKIYAAITAIWGVASVAGPLFGGLFGDGNLWRWLFWLFAGQGLVVAAAASVMLPRRDTRNSDTSVSWTQLAMIGLGVAAFGLADLAGDFLQSAGLALVGTGALVGMVRWDRHATVRLLPLGAHSLATTAGQGYAAQFLLSAASMGFSVYGPIIMQQLAGMTPLAAGYLIAGEALAWTVAGIAVSQIDDRRRGMMVRLGTALVPISVMASVFVFPIGSVAGVGFAGILLGAGFGLCWAFISQSLLTSLSGDERVIGAVGINTIRWTGLAAGTSMAAAAANLAGVVEGFTPRTAGAAGFWIFVAMLPPALAGVVPAWQLAKRLGRGAEAMTEGENSTVDARAGQAIVE
jgi:MFS family permease